MNQKKLGVVFLVLSVGLTLLLFQMSSGLHLASEEQGCFENDNCERIQSGLGITHFAFGFIGFILALAFYLLFFSVGEEAVLRRLEKDQQQALQQDRFLLLRGLDPAEKEVMKAVKEQEGITQSTLRLRITMSKAKLSYVLGALEKRGLLRREPKGKSCAVFLTDCY